MHWKFWDKTRQYLHWTDSAAQIAEEIRKRSPVELKLVLKTRNETAFLRDWIEHHIPIVGLEGIVIFDHNSDNPETLEIYRQYGRRLLVFQFSGHHNALHDSRIVPDLYDAIRRSCKYYCFLDTDELLFWAEPDGSIISNSSIPQKVIATGEAILPGVWIENAPGQNKELLISFHHERMRSGLEAGKPVVRSTSVIKGFANHNIQLGCEHFSGCKSANLIVMHRKNFSPEQRILANLEKLRRYNLSTKQLECFGMFGNDFDEFKILRVDVNQIPRGNARNYIAEIQKIHEFGQLLTTEEVASMSAKIEHDELVFTDLQTMRIFNEFLLDPTEFIKSVLVDR
jgi:hypothetical protein